MKCTRCWQNQIIVRTVFKMLQRLSHFIIGVLFIIFACSVSILLVDSFQGVDISAPTTDTQWSCLRDTINTSFGIIRIYRSIGEMDDNAVDNLYKAYNAGIRDLGVYLFPCIASSSYAILHNITCQSPKQQIINTAQYLASNNILFDLNNQLHANKKTIYLNRLWLDIEDENPSKYYDANVTVNQNFIYELISTGKKMNIPIGIYTTRTYWTQIMNGITDYSKQYDYDDGGDYIYPLWYPRYDHIDSMDFFEPFSGWDEALIKQTGGSVSYCGLAQIDTDYKDDYRDKRKMQDLKT